MIRRLTGLAGLALAFNSAPAWAHSGHDEGAGFLSGFLHPLTGMDHLAAMVAVGLWAGLLVRRALWVLPAAFLGAILAGFAASAVFHSGTVEPMILLSLVVFGGAAALRWHAPLPLAAIAVALFGFAHGQAHGLEAPHGALPLFFAAGLFVSTTVLHGFGCGLAAVLPTKLTRALGGACAALGLALAGAA
jgi:urease accessory protein